MSKLSEIEARDAKSPPFIAQNYAEADRRYLLGLVKDANTEVERLRAEVEAEIRGCNMVCEQHAAERIEWRHKLAKAVAALEYYRDGHTDSYGNPQRHDYRALCPRCHDKGERAAQTLKEIGE